MQRPKPSQETAVLTYEKLREEFTDAKRRELFNKIGDGSSAAESRVSSGQAELTYYLTMLQVTSAERAGRQLAQATWVLAFVTAGLFIATIVLVVVTARGGG